MKNVRIRNVRIIEHISMDGVIQAPGGRNEGGDDYPHGGWAAVRWITPIARMAFFDTYQTLGVATEIMGITPEGLIAIKQMQRARRGQFVASRICKHPRTPNETPGLATMAVTSRAPRSTSRNTRGRGST